MITKTFQVKDSDREWYLVDAKGAILGRLATQVANLLRGKEKPTYSPNVDGGANVIIINAEKIELSTEAKRENKTHYWHTGYPGGIKQETFKETMEKHPERAIERAVKRMLPKNLLAAKQMKRLKIYVGSEHPHTQKLIEYKIAQKVKES